MTWPAVGDLALFVRQFKISLSPLPLPLPLFPQCRYTIAKFIVPDRGDRVGSSRGLSYRPASLHRLAEKIPWNRFLGSLKVWKYRLSWQTSELFQKRKPSWRQVITLVVTPSSPQQVQKLVPLPPRPTRQTWSLQPHNFTYILLGTAHKYSLLIPVLKKSSSISLGATHTCNCTCYMHVLLAVNYYKEAVSGFGIPRGIIMCAKAGGGGKACRNFYAPHTLSPLNIFLGTNQQAP